MLQRIQTVFLIGAVICGIVALLSPVLVLPSTHGLVTISPLELDVPDKVALGDVPLNWPLAVLLGVQIALALITILLFKNRKLQMRLQSLSSVVLLAFFGVVVFYFLGWDKAGENAPFPFGLASILAVVALILQLLALRAIRKDESLVRSLDRLR